MKELIFKISFSIVLFNLLFLQQALAVACEAITSCPTDYPTEMTHTESGNDICLNASGVSKISEIVEVGNIGDTNLTDDVIKVCFTGDSAGPQYDRGREGGGIHNNNDLRCCPSGSRAVYKDNGILGGYEINCCPSGFTEDTWGDSDMSTPSSPDYDRNGSGNGVCYSVRVSDRDRAEGEASNMNENDSRRAEAVGDYSPTNVEGVLAVAQRTANYFCGSNEAGRLNCIKDSGGNPIERDESLLFPPDQATQCANQCEAHNSGTPINDEDNEVKYCYDGQWKTYDEWQKLTTIPQGCQNIVEHYGADPPESALKELENCRKCYFGASFDDEGVTPTPRPGFVYSSLGCIDVSRDGLITRIFQIGIGLIGGIMIVRFIQAALKMQTDNPEEIKEAQEMISSAVIALFVLVASVAILRFLGINVLNVLPQNFLQ